ITVKSSKPCLQSPCLSQKKKQLLGLTFCVYDFSLSGASVVAIDNKIEQAMDLVKSHLMFAVREEVEVLKEQIKDLIDRNTQLEQENTLLKTLASPEQIAQFQSQVQTGSPPVSFLKWLAPGGKSWPFINNIPSCVG
uniref:TSC22 domain family protein 1 n=1 Tax=Gadus morhua TaxID=8049 RepID=A0A8C5CEM7_GADMO